MTASKHILHVCIGLAAIVLLSFGCAVRKQTTYSSGDTHSVLNSPVGEKIETTERKHVSLVSYRESPRNDNAFIGSDAAAELHHESLADIEALVGNNPTLRRISNECHAALAKVRYIDELPDPRLSANFFGHPIETAAGSQRSNLTLSQMLPWLPRLDAKANQACFEAAALAQAYQSNRLKLVADLRALWFQLYVVDKQIEINQASKESLESLIEVATSQVETGKATQGDVLAGTIEYAKLEEQRLAYQQQLAATVARINRLVGRDAETPIVAPSTIDARLPDYDLPMLRSLARSNQPEIEAARIRRHATRWGVEIARLSQRPDFTLNASWFAIDDNRPSSDIINVGEDAWSLGAMMTLPIRHEKYNAMEQEALWKHAAASHSIEEVAQQYEAILVDLSQQAIAADETARLYQDTIIPEAKRALRADQEAYMNGRVEFDRVVRDFRNLLTLQLGYHRSIGRLATATARIQQATGVDIAAD